LPSYPQKRSSLALLLETPTGASNQDAKSRDPYERIQFGFA